jgi:hypothetical protein
MSRTRINRGFFNFQQCLNAPNLSGKDVSAGDIVFKKAEPVPASAKELLATLKKASPVNKSK